MLITLVRDVNYMSSTLRELNSANFYIILLLFVVFMVKYYNYIFIIIICFFYYVLKYAVFDLNT